MGSSQIRTLLHSKENNGVKSTQKMKKVALTIQSTNIQNIYLLKVTYFKIRFKQNLTGKMNTNSSNGELQAKGLAQQQKCPPGKPEVMSTIFSTKKRNKTNIKKKEKNEETQIVNST